jgi:hypothetical protein
MQMDLRTDIELINTVLGGVGGKLHSRWVVYLLVVHVPIILLHAYVVELGSNTIGTRTTQWGAT